jgi:hypothetical protein
MDTPESITIEITTNAVVVAGFGASTSTSTEALPSASAPKIGIVSTEITWYFQPVAKPTLPAAPGQGHPRKRGPRHVIVPSLPAMIANGTCPELLVPETADDPPPLHKRRCKSIGANLDPFTIGCTKQFRIGLTMARIGLMIMGKLSATTLSMHVVSAFLARHSTNIFIQMKKASCSWRQLTW